MEAEVAAALNQNCGAEDVCGHQVRRGLDAMEAQAEQAAKGLDDQRLGDARDAFKQGMALAKDGDEHLFDGPFLAGNHAAKLFARMGDQLVGCTKMAGFGLRRFYRDWRWRSVLHGFLIRVLA